jgi:acyl carrier protein
MAEQSTTTQAAQLRYIEDLVVEMLASILYVEPAAVDLDVPVLDLGLDSILVVEFCALVEKRLGASLPASTVHRLATGRKVAAHLAGEHVD